MWHVLPQRDIAYIDIRFFAHATENLEKVVKAAQNVFPSNQAEDVTFKKSNLQGHYGNPITIFEARIKNKETICALVENISSNLSELDKETINREINLHIEKGKLYIRLDKQAAFKGRLKLCTSDPIRICIRFKKKKIEDVLKVLRELGMLK